LKASGLYRLKPLSDVCGAYGLKDTCTVGVITGAPVETTGRVEHLIVDGAKRPQLDAR